MNNIIPSTGKAPRSLVPISSSKLLAKEKKPKATPTGAASLEPQVIDIPAVEDFPPDPDAIPAFNDMEATAIPLTPPQRTALIMLTKGLSQMEAANAAGVSRCTLHRWLRQDAEFQAAYNAWQQDALATAQNDLRAAMQAAVATVLDAIERRNDANLAWKLLQSQGATVPPRPGTSDAEELRRTQTLERRKKMVEQGQELQRIELEEPMLGPGDNQTGK